MPPVPPRQFIDLRRVVIVSADQVVPVFRTSRSVRLVRPLLPLTSLRRLLVVRSELCRTVIALASSTSRRHDTSPTTAAGDENSDAILGDRRVRPEAPLRGRRATPLTRSFGWAVPEAGGMSVGPRLVATSSGFGHHALV